MPILNPHRLRRVAALSLLSLSSLWSATGAALAAPPDHPASPAHHSAEADAAPLRPGAHQVVLNGIATHYQVAGSGPVLLIQAPSWGIGSTYLLNGLSALARQFTLVAYDVPGSGASDKPAGGYKLTTSEIADHLDALRRHLRLDTIDLLGHSQGSALAIGYAARYPAQVRKLILVGSQLYGYTGQAESDALYRVRKADPRFAEAIAAQATPAPADDAHYTERFIRSATYYLYAPKDAPAFVATLTTPLSAWPAHAKSRPGSGASDEQQPAMLPQITARTLVIDGLEDPVCPPLVSARIQQGIAGAQLLIYEHTGHFPWIEQPGRFFDDVTRFLQQ